MVAADATRAVRRAHTQQVYLCDQVLCQEESGCSLTIDMLRAKMYIPLKACNKCHKVRFCMQP